VKFTGLGPEIPMATANVFQEIQLLGNGDVESLCCLNLIGNISVKELQEIRTLKSPPKAARQTLEVVWLLLEANKPNSWRRGKSTKPPLWPQVQMMLERSFIERLLKFDVAVLVEVPHLSEFIVSQYFKSNEHKPLTFSRVKRANTCAAALFRWCSQKLKISENEEEAELANQVETEHEDTELGGEVETGSEPECHEAQDVKPEFGKESTADSKLDEAGVKNEEFEVLTDFGWRPDAMLSRRVQAAGGLSHCAPCFQIAGRGFTYTIDLKHMKQMNNATGKVRPMRLRHQ